MMLNDLSHLGYLTLKGEGKKGGTGKGFILALSSRPREGAFQQESNRVVR